MIGIFDEGIHEPELDGFDILGFEIGIIKFTHDATPTAARLCKGTLSGKSCAELGRSDIEVVGAAFFGIKGHIKLIDICELALCQLLIREDLLLIYATGIGAGTVLLVDVAGAIGTVEYVVDTVPGKFCPVETIGEACSRGGFGEHGEREPEVLRGGGKMPIGDTFEVNTALRALEIIDISYRSFFVSCGTIV